MKIYFIVTFCNSESVVKALDHMIKLTKEGHDLYTIMTYNMGRYASLVHKDFRKAVEKATGRKPIYFFGQDDGKLPQEDQTIIFPCNFNTISKIALGIADSLATSLIHASISSKKPIELYPALTNYENHPLLDDYLGKIEKMGIEIVKDMPEEQVVQQDEQEQEPQTYKEALEEVKKEAGVSEFRL